MAMVRPHRIDQNFSGEVVQVDTACYYNRFWKISILKKSRQEPAFFIQQNMDGRIRRLLKNLPVILCKQMRDQLRISAVNPFSLSNAG